jgi:hypothetical protein
VLPATIGIVFLGDQVRSGYALVATAGFLIAVSACRPVGMKDAPEPRIETERSGCDF